jgi:hypothetical protein
MQEKYCPTPELDCEIYQECFNEGESISLIKVTRGSLLHAVQSAYHKHHLGDDSIGWDELSDIMCDALCNEMGNVGFQKWLKKVSA